MTTLSRTSWPHVACGVFGGVAVALLVGKMPAVLPLVQAQFDADLAAIGVYISLLSLVFAVGGIFFGFVVRMIGPRRAAILGLALGALGSGLGALAPNFALLFATRLLEALGYALSVTAIPSLIQARAAPADRPLAMSLWGTWMAVGVGVILGISALWLDALGWRGMFAVVSATLAVAAVLTALSFRDELKLVGALPRIRSVLRRDPIRHLLAFVMFSAPVLTLMSFLPSLLSDLHGLSHELSNGIVTGAVLIMIPATIGAGALIGRGADPARLAAGCFGASAVLALPVFLHASPLWLAVAGAYGLNIAWGVVAGVLWSAVPRMSLTPDEAPMISGVLFQGAGLGQFIGPPLAGFLVERGGWDGVLLMIVPMSLAGLLLARRFGRP